MPEQIQSIDEPNRWRLETPGHSGWERTASPDDPGHYLMISADSHCNEPTNLWYERIDAKYRERLPHIETDANGVKWQISEGWARSRLLDSNLEGEDKIVSVALVEAAVTDEPPANGEPAPPSEEPPAPTGESE